MTAERCYVPFSDAHHRPSRARCIAGRVLDLDPVSRWARAVRRAEPLRRDAFEPEPAGVPEHGGTVLIGVNTRPADGPENDIRCHVTRRKVSAGTRIGRDCRDSFLGLAKTCAKLEVA